MSTVNKEIIDAQYHCRYLQLQGIKTEAENLFTGEYESVIEDMRALACLMITPPVYLPLQFERFPGKEQELFERSGNGLKVMAQKARVFCVLDKLILAADSTNRRTTEVEIDYQETSIKPEFTAAFARHPEILSAVVAKGRENAWKHLLKLVQKEETPLMRLRRDMAARAGLSLTPAIGGLVGSLSTKVDSVQLRYFYPKDQSLPSLSLVVNPIKSA